MKGLINTSKKNMHPSDVCETVHVHEDAIENVVNTIPDDDDVISLSDTFKVLSDMSRLKIVFALMNTELCVCDICQVLNMSQSAISHQLRVLRSAHMVKYRKDGKMVYYSIDDSHVSNIINMSLEHMKHTNN